MQARKEKMVPDRLRSICSTSRVKRLSRRPLGCESKKERGRRSTRHSSCEWRERAAKMQPRVSSMARREEMTAEAIVEEAYTV